jgi:hypothetical protein
MLFISDFGARDFLKNIRVPRTAFRELKQDLKSTRWLRGLGWSVGVIWFLGLLIGAIILSIVQSFSTSDTACPPDGTFRFNPETYSTWSSTGFFQITWAGGHLSFAQAKVVDIVWDIVRSIRESMRAIHY